MAEDEDVTTGLTNVPPWVLRLVRDLAETKSDVKNLVRGQGEIAIRLDTFTTKSEHLEFIKRFEDVVSNRIDPLWNHYQQEVGSEKQRRRTENLWRWGLATALTALTLFVMAKTGGIHIQL